MVNSLQEMFTKHFQTVFKLTDYT